MKKKNNRLLNYKFWIDLLMPNRCPVCGEVIVWNELICKSCEKSLPFLDDPFVLKYKFQENITELKDLCAVFSYEGNSVSGIYNLKTRKGLNFAEYASNYICKYLCDKNIDKCIDAVVFVPMPKGKKLSRGYNQAEKISVFIAERLNKPVIKKLLERLPKSYDQHSLGYEQRLENAESSYVLNAEHENIEGKNILICDDVATTGATLNKCAKLLKSIGAKSVYSAAICSTILKK